MQNKTFLRVLQSGLSTPAARDGIKTLLAKREITAADVADLATAWQQNTEVAAQEKAVLAELAEKMEDAK